MMDAGISSKNIRALKHYLFLPENTHINVLKKELVDQITSGNLQTGNAIITSRAKSE